MKRCIKAHNVAAFGDIPVGSLWADDSPYIEDEANFVDADTPVEVEEYAAVFDTPKSRPVKKSAAKSVKES